MSDFRRSVAAIRRTLTTAALAALALAGCANECDVARAPRCDGDVRVSCRWDGEGPFSSTRLDRTRCAVACRTLRDGALCVESTAPVAECATAVSPVCWGGGVTACRDGYPTTTDACVPGTGCQVTGCGPSCVVGAKAEPRCAASPQGFCDEDTLVSCQCGWAASRRGCGSGRCQTVEDMSFCSLTDAVDPRCGDPAAPEAGFCDENTGYSCQYGYVVGAIGCGTGRCTSSTARFPSCVLTVDKE